MTDNTQPLRPGDRVQTTRDLIAFFQGDKLLPAGTEGVVGMTPTHYAATQRLVRFPHDYAIVKLADLARLEADDAN